MSRRSAELRCRNSREPVYDASQHETTGIASHKGTYDFIMAQALFVRFSVWSCKAAVPLCHRSVGTCVKPHLGSEAVLKQLQAQDTAVSAHACSGMASL